MRAATFFITILAIAPSFTFAAPIGAAHYEELEARWNPFHLNAQQQQKVQKFEHGVASVVKTAAPIALSVAPLIFKRDEEQHLERRLSEKAKHFWKDVGQGAETAWNTLGPTAAELTASHFKLIPKRDVEEHLEARSLEFEDVAEALAKRAEMPEQLERRHLSEKAKTFWKGVGNGAETVFEQLGPLALKVGAHAVNY